MIPPVLDEPVSAQTADEGVVAREAPNHVVAAEPADPVAARRALEDVVAVGAPDGAAVGLRFLVPLRVVVARGAPRVLEVHLAVAVVVLAVVALRIGFRWRLRAPAGPSECGTGVDEPRAEFRVLAVGTEVLRRALYATLDLHVVEA